MPEINLPVSWSKDGSFDKAFDELEREIEDTVRGLTVEVWNGILNRTPQFFGRMAASWSYSLDYPAFWDRSNLVETDTRNTKSKGRVEATNIARNYSAGVDKYYRLGDTVFISNGVDHGEGPYSVDVEEGNIFLRAVNRPGRPVARTLDSIGTKYGGDRSISANAAIKLRGMTVAEG